MSNSSLSAFDALFATTIMPLLSSSAARPPQLRHSLEEEAPSGRTAALRAIRRKLHSLKHEYHWRYYVNFGTPNRLNRSVSASLAALGVLTVLGVAALFSYWLYRCRRLYGQRRGDDELAILQHEQDDHSSATQLVLFNGHDDDTTPFALNTADT